MPDGPYATPDEERVLRMIDTAGSPQDAGRSLIARLEALEAAVAALEAQAQPEPAAEAAEDTPAE
jgi:hypothetical protein